MLILVAILFAVAVYLLVAIPMSFYSAPAIFVGMVCTIMVGLIIIEMTEYYARKKRKKVFEDNINFTKQNIIEDFFIINDKNLSSTNLVTVNSINETDERPVRYETDETPHRPTLNNYDSSSSCSSYVSYDSSSSCSSSSTTSSSGCD